MKKNGQHEARTKAGTITAEEAITAVYATSGPTISSSQSVLSVTPSQSVPPSRVGTRAVGWRLPVDLIEAVEARKWVEHTTQQAIAEKALRAYLATAGGSMNAEQ